MKTKPSTDYTHFTDWFHLWNPRNLWIRVLVFSISDGCFCWLERLQIFHQILLLFGGESQIEQHVVMINDHHQIRSASVMEIRRMLPKRAKRCRSVLFCRATLRSQRVSAYLCRIMQERNVGVGSTKNISKGGRDVAGCAACLRFEQCLTPFRGHLIEGTGRRARCRQAKLILEQCW